MSLSVHCSFDEFALFALEVEQETQRELAEIHDCLAERGERVLVSFLRDLATPSSDSRPAAAGDGRARYHLVYAIPDSRKLLEVALEAKRRAWSAFDGFARAARNPDVRDLAATLADVEGRELRAVAQALDAVPTAADWESLVAQGTVPALALGAERRLRRAPR